MYFQPVHIYNNNGHDLKRHTAYEFLRRVSAQYVSLPSIGAECSLSCICWLAARVSEADVKK